MTFHDLPPGWPTRSLDDPVLAADVVDLVVRESDRADRCIALLLCDDDGRMIQPVTVGEMPSPSTEEERKQLFDAFLGHLGGAFAGLVLAVGAPSGRAPDDDARAWHETGMARCRDAGVRLIATYLATHDAVTLMPSWVQQDRLAG